ncbi:hypothetical protein JMG10_08660 [Nostoc ellipsosporum NOK]|nr:hypothetical protein [Nostoc ellipsosporum NOK]
MKKVFIFSLLLLTGIVVNAQSEKYVKSMEKLIQVMDTTWNTDKLVELSNSFERIAEAEKTQWLPYYYAALARVNAGYALGKNNAADQTDPYANKAEELINKADAIEANNSEIYIVKKLINTLKLIGDVMGRYMTAGAASAEALAKAKSLNPENPRVYLQEGIDKMNTPPQFGGSVEDGKKILQTSLEKFKAFKPASSIHPHWGESMAQRFLNR